MKKIIITPEGNVRFIYDDSLRPLMDIGEATISRASYVEPDPDNPTTWMVDLAPVGGPIQRGFVERKQALQWEVDWLNEHKLGLESEDK